MKEGSAQMWAFTFTKKALANAIPSFGTYPDFITKFTTGTQRVKPSNGSPTPMSHKDYHSMTTSPSSTTMQKSVTLLMKIH